jgi:glycosidase
MTYHHVDPAFGPDRAGDWRVIADEDPGDETSWKWTAADRFLLKLVEACHARGMRVILDGVFNHMGIRSWVFEDVKRRQQASPYKDWFVIRSWDDPSLGTAFDFVGWSGTRELPEWREDANGLAAGPRDYIFAITRRWMDPDGDGDPRDGIDGWRLDVAYCVGHPFWKAWRQQVKSINPEAYLVAEIVDPPEQLKPYLAGDEFDAVMNYNFAYACDEFLFASNAIAASLFDQRLRELRDAFAPEVAYGQFNLFDSHDTARLATHAIAEGQLNYRHWDRYYLEAKGDRGILPARAPNESERRRARLVVFMQMTYVGAPVVYYGDEAGMWGPNDPCCRKPMLWPELRYADESVNPDRSPREPPDPVSFDAALHGYYRTLATLRHGHEALRRGGFRTALADDAQRVYGFWREQNGERRLVILNASDAPAVVRIEAEGAWLDLLDTAYRAEARAGIVEISLPPVSGRILSPHAL